MIQNDTPALSRQAMNKCVSAPVPHNSWNQWFAFIIYMSSPCLKYDLTTMSLPWSESNQRQMLQPLHLLPLILSSPKKSWSQSDVFNMQGVAFCTIYSFC